MKFTPRQYAQALYDSIEGTNTKDHELILDNFVKILAANGHLEKYQEIAAEYSRLEREAKGIKDVNATFAREINPKILDELNTIIQGKAEFKTKIDEGIVGGIVVRVDDTLIDASIRTQLDDLNRTLRES